MLVERVHHGVKALKTHTSEAQEMAKTSWFGCHDECSDFLVKAIESSGTAATASSAITKDDDGDTSREGVCSSDNSSLCQS